MFSFHNQVTAKINQWYCYSSDKSDKLKPPFPNGNLNLAKENLCDPLYQIIFLNNLSIQRKYLSGININLGT